MKTKILKLLIFLMLCSKGMSAQWETVYYPDSLLSLPFLHAVEFRDFNTGFTVGNLLDASSSCILRTTDNGTSWDTVYAPADSLSFNDVTFADSATIFAVSRREYCCSSSIGTIVKTTDLGATWTSTVATTGLNAVYFSTPAIGYIAGNSGTILKTTDSGVTWNSLSTGVSFDLYSVYFVDSNIGFACGSSTILKTINGGTTWTAQTMTSPGNLNKIFFPSDSVGYCQAMGWSSDMTLYKTIDQGTTWNLIYTLPAPISYLSMFFTDINTGYIVGQFAVLKTTDGGTTWNPQTASPPGASDFYDDVTDICFINKDTGFVVGWGQFYRTTSAGMFMTSVNDQKGSMDGNMLVFPNPAKNDLTLEFENQTTNDVFIEIKNVLGQTMYSEEMKNIIGKQSKNIDVSAFSNGVYFVQLKNEDKITSKKFIKE